MGMLHSHDPHGRYHHDDTWNMTIETSVRTANLPCHIPEVYRLRFSKVTPAPKEKDTGYSIVLVNIKGQFTSKKKHVAKRKSQKKMVPSSSNSTLPLNTNALFANGNRISCRLKCANLRFSFGIVLRQKSATSQRVHLLMVVSASTKVAMVTVILVYHMYTYAYLCAYCT